MNEGKLRKWCRLFKKGRTNMHKEERSKLASSSSEKSWSTLLHSVANLH